MSDRIAQFSALVAAQPANPLFRFSLAQALDAAGRLPEAAEHYQTCVAARADWMMPRILLGKLLLRSGDPAAARPLLEDALRLAHEQNHEDPAAELSALLAGL
ncbi:MAG: tetratricopeptide repeat protein [Opitutaceae bacterium]|jgi:predicted Zn-dependent protease|nr:tetratricopeptide repeat protein [Opitutaceae bacterium]